MQTNGTNNIDFSIVVPFYNKEKTIERCITSLISQDYPKEKYEIIFVNNNSSDASCNIVMRYPVVKLFHEEKQGAYIARNKGILNSNGSFIVFTDADTEVKKDWLSNIYKLVMKNNHEILIGWYHSVGASRVSFVHNCFKTEKIKLALGQRVTDLLVSTASNFIVKREIFVKEGPFFDIPRGEDSYFLIRCFKKGYNIGFSEDIEAQRNDIYSLKIDLLKTFIYSCASGLYINANKNFLRDRKSILITIKALFRIMVKYFPEGVGILLFICVYFAGYFLSRTRILSHQKISSIIKICAAFVNHKESLNINI